MLPQTELIIRHLRRIFGQLRLALLLASLPAALSQWFRLLELARILVFLSWLLLLSRPGPRCFTLGSPCGFAGLCGWGRLRSCCGLRLRARLLSGSLGASRLRRGRLTALFSHRSEVLRTASLFLQLCFGHFLRARASWAKFFSIGTIAVLALLFQLLTVKFFLSSLLFVGVFFFVIGRRLVILFLISMLLPVLAVVPTAIVIVVVSFMVTVLLMPHVLLVLQVGVGVGWLRLPVALILVIRLSFTEIVTLVVVLRILMPSGKMVVLIVFRRLIVLGVHFPLIMMTVTGVCETKAVVFTIVLMVPMLLRIFWIIFMLVMIVMLLMMDRAEPVILLVEIAMMRLVEVIVMMIVAMVIITVAI